MAIRDSRVYYGVCQTAGGESIKDVVIQNPVFVEQGVLSYLDLEIGDKLIVRFVNGNSNPSPILHLSINDSGQNITMSNDTINGQIIIDTYDTVSWHTSCLVEFVYVWHSIGGYVDDQEQEVIEREKWWKIDRPKLGTSSRPGLLQAASTKSEMNNESDNTDFIVPTCNLTQQLVTEAIAAMGLQLSTSSTTGINTVTLRTNYSNKAIELPKIPTKTSELSNTGWYGRENEHFFTNIYNIAFIENGLGIGRRYYDKNNNAQTLVNFSPYSQSSNGDTNYCSVGYGGLYHYQNGTKDSSNNTISPEPHTNIYGKQIGIWFDVSDNMSIGTVNTKDNKNVYDSIYIFDKNKVTFKKDLYIKNNTIHCENLMIPHPTQAGELNIKQYVQHWVHNAIMVENITIGPVIVTKGSSIVKTSSTATETSNPAYPIPDKENYTPIAMGGFNLTEAEAGKYHPSRVYLWECYINKNANNKYELRYALFNTDSQDNHVYVKVRVLYRRNELY